jgi:4,5-dihydroxyphthalate decarboxylase
MAKLNLSLAVGPYDRTRALIDGTVQIDGVTTAGMTLPPEEIFFRALRHAEFDICELSLSSFTVMTAKGGGPYVGVPAFVSRAFRHTSIYVRTDRIKKPEDLKGKRVGVPEYQLTAIVWARAILQDDYGVKPADVHWIRGGIEDADRPEKISISLPSDVKLDNAPAGKSISRLLADGDIDAFIAPRPPALPKNTPNVGWLFSDPAAAAADYFKRTGIFPSCTWSGSGAALPSSTRGCRARCSRRFRRLKRWRSICSVIPRPPRSRCRSSRSGWRRPAS